MGIGAGGGVALAGSGSDSTGGIDRTVASGGYVDSLSVLPYNGPVGVYVGEGRILTNGLAGVDFADREVIVGEPIRAGALVSQGADGRFYNFKVTKADE